MAGLEPADAVVLRAADAHGPDVVAKFASGAGFGDYVGKTVTIEIELAGGARAFSVAWV